MGRTPGTHVVFCWPCVLVTIGDLTAVARLDIPIVTGFVWATGEWAIIFLGLICLRVVGEVYIIAIALRV